MNEKRAQENEAQHEVAQGAAPRAEGLDVERLGEAGGNVLDGRRIGSVRLYRNTITPDDWESIAAEYARLSRPSDEGEKPQRVQERPVCKRFRHDEHCIDEPHA